MLPDTPPTQLELLELPTASELLLAGGLGLCSLQESKQASKEKKHKKTRSCISCPLF
jgi:hypothetical protein